jgi:hypothetical protein
VRQASVGAPDLGSDVHGQEILAGEHDASCRRFLPEVASPCFERPRDKPSNEGETCGSPLIRTAPHIAAYRLIASSIVPSPAMFRIRDRPASVTS